MLLGLWHRSVGSANNQDRAVHLSGTGDHVLDKVSVTRAVDVCVVPVFRLVLHVRCSDRYRLGRIPNCTTLSDISIRLRLRQTLRSLNREQRTSGGCLAVVDVTIVPTLQWGLVRSIALWPLLTHNTYTNKKLEHRVV